MFVVAAFYKFSTLDDFAEMQTPLQDFCREAGLKGSVLLAREGINGTVVGTREGIDALFDRFRQDPRLADIEHKESPAKELPFLRMKVRLKQEIVRLGVPEVDPNIAVGTYVSPKDWNKLIADPDVVVIDTRNDYEVDIGTFKGAVNPETKAFGEFPEYVKNRLGGATDKKIAMFCTGGIRCEKASSLMLSMGFDEVYHLKGGILKYLEEVPADQSLWEGECFVFDERVSVTHGLAQGSYELCRGCRQPISEADKQSPQFEEGVSCPHCCDTLTEFQKTRFRHRQYQINLARERREKHLGQQGANGVE